MKEVAKGADRLPCISVSTACRDLSKEHLPVTNLNGLVTSLSSSCAMLLSSFERIGYGIRKL